jgi:hypothetical protein
MATKTTSWKADDELNREIGMWLENIDTIKCTASVWDIFQYGK